jgi:hypothetical protein
VEIRRGETVIVLLEGSEEEIALAVRALEAVDGGGGGER